MLASRSGNLVRPEAEVEPNLLAIDEMLESLKTLKVSAALASRPRVVEGVLCSERASPRQQQSALAASQ
eukprot:1888237-Pleurochrysis_carterae.AAC.1